MKTTIKKKSDYWFGIGRYTNKWLEEAISKDPSSWTELFGKGDSLREKPANLPIEGSEYHLLTAEEDNEDVKMTFVFVIELLRISPVRAFFNLKNGGIYLSRTGDAKLLQNEMIRAGQAIRRLKDIEFALR